MTKKPVSGEIDIDEAMAISGKSRTTLMRLKRAGQLTARTEKREHIQRQNRLLFREAEIRALAGTDEG